MRTPSLSRRSLLKGSAAAAMASLTSPLPAFAQGHDRFVARMERDVQNLDPAFRISTVEGNILRATCQGLVTFKPDSTEWRLDAAQSIKQVSPTVIEFKLKPNQKFHGGYGTLSANDVRFSFMRFNNPPPGGKPATYASDWGQLADVEVTGPLAGRLVLKNPAPALWTTALADTSGVIVSKAAFEKLGDKVATQVIGSGPYMQGEWVPEQRFVLRANPDWKGPKPAFREIILRPIQDSKTADIAFRSDEVHFTRIDLAAFDDISKSADAATTKLDGIDYIWVGLNVEKPPLDNLKVRQAIRLAVDVDGALLAAYDGKVKRAKTLIPPPILGHWGEAPVYRRDVAAAKRLLGEAGLGSGLKLKLTVLNQATYRTAAQVIQASLGEAGIQCEIDALDGGAFWSSGKEPKGKDLELSLQLFKGKFDPSFYTQWFVSSQVGEWNWQRWKNPEYDALHQKAASTLDAAERAKALVRMQQLMDESAAFIWLTHDVLTFAARRWLKPALLPNGNDWQLGDFRAS